MTDIVHDFSPLYPFLSGQRFKENLVIDYQRVGDVRFRDDVLIKMCSNKRVLHIGCCDHVPLIKDKMRDGTWLHKSLSDCSEYTLGVDIDEKAVSAAREISGYQNIMTGDITSVPIIPEVAFQKFDIAIFGEVVEHISNPVAFLNSFRENYGHCCRQIVITVPNAFRGGNVLGIFRNTESINSDHRFFFTPYTISKIAVEAGIKPLTVTMASFTKANKIKSLILKARPLLAEDIIFVGEC